MAKLIIKLVNSVGEVVNNDADVGGRLRVVFLPDYNVLSGSVFIRPLTFPNRFRWPAKKRPAQAI